MRVILFSEKFGVMVTSSFSATNSTSPASIMHCTLTFTSTARAESVCSHAHKLSGACSWYAWNVRCAVVYENLVAYTEPRELSKFFLRACTGSSAGVSGWCVLWARLPNYTQTVVSTLLERFHTRLAMSSELSCALYSNNILAAGLPPFSLLAFSARWGVWKRGACYARCLLRRESLEAFVGTSFVWCAFLNCFEASGLAEFTVFALGALCGFRETVHTVHSISNRSHYLCRQNRLGPAMCGI